MALAAYGEAAASPRSRVTPLWRNRSCSSELERTATSSAYRPFGSAATIGGQPPHTWPLAAYGESWGAQGGGSHPRAHRSRGRQQPAQPALGTSRWRVLPAGARPLHSRPALLRPACLRAVPRLHQPDRGRSKTTVRRRVKASRCSRRPGLAAASSDGGEQAVFLCCARFARWHRNRSLRSRGLRCLPHVRGCVPGSAVGERGRAEVSLVAPSGNAQVLGSRQRGQPAAGGAAAV
jgi:hypothetical protein